MLDPRIYGLPRPCKGERLDYFGWTIREMAAWKRRWLPLSPVLTAFDLTPAGQVALLRRRGYTDPEIRQAFPALAALV